MKDVTSSKQPMPRVTITSNTYVYKVYKKFDM